ncbi:MAG: response regulator transcription factor [Pseudomonadota bacterium]
MIADEFAIVREGLVSVLNSDQGIVVVGEAANREDVFSVLAATQADVLLLDLKISKHSTSDFFENLLLPNNDLEVIALSSNVRKFDMHLSLTYGATGYLSKQARGEDYIRAVKAVANGYAFIPSEYIDDFRETHRKMSRTGNMYGLSPRELQVLFACKHYDNAQQIADQLDISVRTVETHRSSIYRKTDCRNLDDLYFLFEGATLRNST